MLTHDDANALLGKRETKKLANNTYLVRRGDDIAVRLHRTDIVTIHPDDSAILDSGGWKTRTTKDRINAYGMPPHSRLYADKGLWWVSTNSWRGERLLYQDGMQVHPDGTFTGYATGGEGQAMRRRIQRYVRKFIQAARRGEVGLPGNGDCFFCLFRTTDTQEAAKRHYGATLRQEQGRQTMGEASGNTDHLLSHLDEDYFVPSLLFRACEWAGWTDFHQALLAKSLTDAMAMTGPWLDDAGRALRRYLYRQFGLSA